MRYGILGFESPRCISYSGGKDSLRRIEVKGFAAGKEYRRKAKRKEAKQRTLPARKEYNRKLRGLTSLVQLAKVSIVRLCHDC